MNGNMLELSTLYVAFRGGTEGRGHWAPVGRLDALPGGYRFRYTQGARMLPEFQPFSEMPALDSVYESAQIFPLFANRLLAKSRPEYGRALQWGGFDPDFPPDPISLLAVTEGRRETDRLELFPAPQPDNDGSYHAKFFLHAIRWMPQAAQDRIATLQPGEPLCLMLDVQNAYDQNAVAVRTEDVAGGVIIGYVPRYLAEDFSTLCSLCQPASVSATVERLNAEAPSQQRLLCRLRAPWPKEFRPCAGEAYRPLVDIPARAAI